MASKKDRTWTRLLEAAGSRAVNHPQFEQTLTRRKLIAEMALTAVTDGVIYFIDGRELQIGSKDWLEFVRWIYTHIDGPAPTTSEVSVSTPVGESIKLEDVTKLSPAERLARISALVESARARTSGSTSNNGQTSTNGFHRTGLEDT